MLGFVNVDILGEGLQHTFPVYFNAFLLHSELIRHKNNPTRRRSLLNSPDSEGRPGELEYTVGFFAKMAPNSELATDGSDTSIPEDFKRENPDFREARSVALNDLEAAVLVTPPDPDWPSGILSIQVHEVRDLKVKTEGRERTMLGKGRKAGEKGQDDRVEQSESGNDFPSSFCTMCVKLPRKLLLKLTNLM